MSTELALVSEVPDVKRLLDLLRINKMEAQYRDFSQLIGYVDTMEKQLTTVLGELNNVRQQLDEIKDKQHPIRTACIKMLDTLQANVDEAKTHLNELKISIINGAKKAVDVFKEKGVAALNSVMSFFKVKNNLNAVRNSVNKSIASAEKSIAKIETMSSELHSIGSHTRNIGRALMGKETKQDVKTNGKIMKIVQSPFRVNKATMSGVKKIVDAAINKLEQLEQTARQNREKAAEKKKKPSILQSVKDYKPPLRDTVADTADKSKKQETSL